MSKFEEGGMTDERYNELMYGPSPQSLTKEESASGWHWCWDFDGLLIHKSWDEMQCCTCIKET
jgi:hypothetical protein